MQVFVGCKHAWETVEQCFECGAIRPAQEPQQHILDDEMKGCPMSKEQIATQIVKELAGAQTAGLGVQLKRLIREARKFAGWPKKDWMR